MASNEQPFDGRIYVMLDGRPQHRLSHERNKPRRSPAEFVRDRLGANDLMAIVHTVGRPDVSQDFTSNKRLLLASVEKTRGCKLPPITANAQDRSAGRASNSCMSDLDASRMRPEDDSCACARWLRVLNRCTVVARRSSSSAKACTSESATTTRPAPAPKREPRRARQLEALIRANASIYGIDPGGIRSGAGEDIVVGRLPLDSTGRSPDLDRVQPFDAL